MNATSPTLATPTPNQPAIPTPPGLRTRVLEVVGNGIVGGMETWVLRLAEQLPTDLFELTALCPYDGLFTERLRALGVECVISAMPDDPSWASLQATCALVQARHIDVLHAHLPNAHLHAALVGRLTDRPVVTTIHGRQMSLLDLEIHRLADSYISTVCRPSYLHALGLGVLPERLSCITNGVDTQVFTPGASDARGTRPAQRRALLRGQAEAALAPEAPWVGFVGRLSPEKGPEVFIRAALLLRDRLPQAHFLMVGDGPLQAPMRALIEQCGLADRVWLLGLREDMPAVYPTLDVLVSTSHSEAMPLAVMEAMACGVPVVATRVGGVPDLVAHGHTGWLVSPGNFEGIAQQVASLIEQPPLRAQMGRCARERAMHSFELRHNVARVGQLLTRLGTPGGVALGGPRRLP